LNDPTGEPFPSHRAIQTDYVRTPGSPRSTLDDPDSREGFVQRELIRGGDGAGQSTGASPRPSSRERGHRPVATGLTTRYARVGFRLSC